MRSHRLVIVAGKRIFSNSAKPLWVPARRDVLPGFVEI